MARTTVIELVDDLTGESGGDVAPVTFALDGVQYEIDLAEQNATDLRDRLAEFVASAKRTGGRLRTSPAASAVARPGGHAAKRSPQELAEVRDWARRAGYTVADVGRVSQSVLDAFDEAQTKPEAKPQARRRARS
jgi:hypothetical protein